MVIQRTISYQIPTLDSIITTLINITVFGLIVLDGFPKIGSIVQVSIAVFMMLYTFKIILRGKIRIHLASWFAIIFSIYCFLVKEWGSGVWLRLGLPFQTAISVGIATCFYIYLIDFLDSEEKRYKIVNAMVYSSLLLIIVLLMLLRSHIFKGLHGNEMTMILSSYGLNSNTIGTYLSISGLLSLVNWFKYRKGRNILFTIILFSFSLLTGSRKTIIYIFVGILGYMTFRTQQKKVRNVFLGLGIIIIFYFLIMNIPILYSVIGRRIDNMVMLIKGLEVVESSLNTRLLMIKLGFEYFSENPVWGHGLNSFAFHYQMVTGREGVYAHNNYIELLVSVGLFGTITYYLKSLVTIRKLVKKKRTELDTMLLSITIALIIGDIAVVTYYYKYYYIILALATTASKGRPSHE